MHYQRYRLLIVFSTVLALASILAWAAQRVYAQPTPIACPRNQTVTLRGANAPPLQSLIVLFAGQPVGGGFSDAAGNWQIPLRVNEPAGMYPVAVQVRNDQRVIASFLCYVDVPVTASPVQIASTTATATSLAQTATPLRPTPTPTATPTSTPRSQPTATSITQSTATPAIRATTTATVTPVRITNTPNVTSTPNATVPPGSTGGAPTRTPTLVPAGLAVTLEIIPYDPNSSASLNEEQVTIRSEEENDLTIAGWRIVNISRPEIPAFVFPAFILQPETDVYLYTGNGTDNLATGDFYWKRNASVWRSGDTANLLDAQGRLVSSYEVR